MTSSGGLFYGRYRTGSSDEWLMRIGAAEAPAVLMLPPLFEEMNRTRALIATVMRMLASNGFGCWLPDLPGTGESALPLEACEWQSWRDAARDAGAHVTEASGTRPVVVSLRGGALLDDAVAGGAFWRFAPAEGASLARDLVRASMLKPEELKSARIELAGYGLSETLLGDLRDAALAGTNPMRTVRLESDRAAADLKLAGPSLWRRSEPANSFELAQLIASDITQWCKQCATC